MMECLSVRFRNAISLGVVVCFTLTQTPAAYAVPPERIFTKDAAKEKAQIEELERIAQKEDIPISEYGR